MTDDYQEKLHAGLIDALPLEDGQVLTGWIVVYEAQGLDGQQVAGHCYGPETMTTWGAMGLIEWARARTLPEAYADDN